MKKVLVLLRGIPGSGKSTKAQEIVDNCFGTHVKCSADDYFINSDGEYVFNRFRLGKAHNQCKENAKQAMKDGVDLVIVDNTNTTKKEMQPYINMAKHYGYQIKFEVVGSFDEESIELYAKRNVHGVPVETIKRMASRFELDVSV